MAKQPEKLIKENVHVLLKKGNNVKVFRAERDRKIVFDKRTFCLNAALDQPFGTSWEVSKNNIIPVRTTERLQGEVQSASDNRDIQDDTGSQRLDRDDIMNLKEQGVSGEGIVEQLVDNSKSFTNKTAYSQEKYLKKKKEKYITKFTIYKPNVRLLCGVFFNKVPSPKIICLREDTLAQLLTCTNVQAGSKVMVVENCQGLLMASVLERLAGKGTIVQFHSEDRPVMIAEDLLDLPCEYRDIALRMQLRDFNKVVKAEGSSCLKGVAGEEGDIAEAMDTHETGHSGALVSEDVEAQEEDSLTHKTRKRDFKDNSEREKKKIMRMEKYRKIKELLEKRDMDSLLIACRFQPALLLNHLLEYLAPSRPFVVYSSFKEPQVECFKQLKDNGSVVNMNLTETWLRHYQILENRTHPMISMSGTGGYVLTGTKISYM